MHHLRRLLLRFLALFTNARSEQELAREIRAHLALVEDEFLHRGMSPEAAHLAARRAYGGVDQAKQLHREERSFQGVAQTAMDIRYTFRQLYKAWGFTAIAILTLALGIGATTAIFSIVERVLLRPLSFPDSKELVVLSDALANDNSSEDGSRGVTAPDILAYTRDTRSFSSLGGYQKTAYEVSGVGAPVEVHAARMTAGIFPALGVQPLLGRVFSEQEDEQDQQVTVLSYSYWKSHLGGDPNVLGMKIQLDRKPYEVIGVMPRNFEFPLLPGHLNASQLWVPMSFAQNELTLGAANWDFGMVGRLRHGITLVQAQDDAERVAREIMRNYPAWMRDTHITARVLPMQESTIKQARPLIRTLFIAVVVVLLIACTNLAALLLVRAIRRNRENAIRLALGASGGALIRQALIEGLFLSLTGGLLGLTFAALLLHLGVSLLPDTVPRISEIGLDWPVVVFALVLALMTGLVCGIAPARYSIRTRVNESLKEGGRTGVGGLGHAQLRSVLVVAEIAIALVLLIASGLLLRSFEKMREVNLGFRPDHTLTASYSLPQKYYSSRSSIEGFDQELLRRLRQLPGVEAVGVTSLLPASGASAASSYVVDGYTPPKGAGMSLAWPSLVFGDYFQAMEVSLLRGRLFTESDTADSPLVAIVNRKLADHYWPGQNPVGKRLRLGTQDTATIPWLTVVGEIGDVKQGTPDGETQEQIYRPAAQDLAGYGLHPSATTLGVNFGSIVLRTTLPPQQMENSLSETVHSIDPQLPLSQMQTMEHAMFDSEAPRRFSTAIISTFAVSAILVAMLGIYGVVASSVASRTQEMAIRMALGAQRSAILTMILTSGAKLAAVGCVLGLVGAAAFSQLLTSLLFGVGPFDPIVLTSSAVAVLLLALAASAVPARRAARVDPMRALRLE
jgi:predicted permease